MAALLDMTSTPLSADEYRRLSQSAEAGAGTGRSDECTALGRLRHRGRPLDRRQSLGSPGARGDRPADVAPARVGSGAASGVDACADECVAAPDAVRRAADVGRRDARAGNRPRRSRRGADDVPLDPPRNLRLAARAELRTRCRRRCCAPPHGRVQSLRSACIAAANLCRMGVLALLHRGRRAAMETSVGSPVRATVVNDAAWTNCSRMRRADGRPSPGATAAQPRAERAAWRSARVGRQSDPGHRRDVGRGSAPRRGAARAGARRAPRLPDAERWRSARARCTGSTRRRGGRRAGFASSASSPATIAYRRRH